MPRWMRALLIAAGATAAAALALEVVPGWKEASPRGDAPDGARHGLPESRPQTHEEVIAALSDEERERMLRELGHHV